jgi:hypothetical protein
MLEQASIDLAQSSTHNSPQWSVFGIRQQKLQKKVLETVMPFHAIVDASLCPS